MMDGTGAILMWADLENLTHKKYRIRSQLIVKIFNLQKRNTWIIHNIINNKLLKIVKLI